MCVSKHYLLSKHYHTCNHDLPLHECLRLRNGSDLRLRVHPTMIKSNIYPTQMIKSLCFKQSDSEFHINASSLSALIIVHHEP